MAEETEDQAIIADVGPGRHSPPLGHSTAVGAAAPAGAVAAISYTSGHAGWEGATGMFFAVGIALATLFLLGVQATGMALRSAAAFVLVIAALVYVLVALAACDSMALNIELAGLAVFAAFAWAGLRWHVGWLVAGWLAHLTWDMGLHMLIRTCTPSVLWYAQLCFAFDLVLAAYLALTMRKRVKKSRF